MQCILPYAFSTSCNYQDQCSIGQSVPSGCFWSRTQPVCLLHASVSTIYLPCNHGSASTSGSVNFAFSASKSVTALTDKPSKVCCWPLGKLLSIGVATRAKSEQDAKRCFTTQGIIGVSSGFLGVRIPTPHGSSVLTPEGVLGEYNGRGSRGS